MINVVIADDQTLVRQGIRSLLEISEAIRVAGEAKDGEDALALLSRVEADVLLLDLRMPVIDGIGVLRELPNLPRPPAVVVLTTFDDDELLLSSAKLGAKGFLLKDVSFEVLTDAITRVAQGESLIAPVVSQRLTSGFLQRQTVNAEPAPELTRRELEVLRFLAGGYANREIAEALHLSEGTVKNHVSVILSKLGVRDRTRAALKGIELGLLG